ncbi:MAG TPA: hypothetical protein VL424_05075 [Pararobbsia sp.]|nr:hypothetical protein [Pararobbsia sp.]
MKLPTPRIGAAVVCVVMSWVAAPAAWAQASTPLVHWQLEIVENGVTVDTFKADTPLEQTQTQTREHEAVHAVGCAQVPQARVSLTRTLAVTPSSADEHGVSFVIDATEALEDPASQQTKEGCTLPPQPRVVHATHPALMVGKTGWTDWTVVAHDPTLVYRLQASVERPPTADTASASAPAMAPDASGVDAVPDTMTSPR